MLFDSAAQAVPCESVSEWWPRYRSIAAEYPETIHQAIAGGFAADRVGWVFASGYQAALHALFPGAPEDRICALCVTEADGNSPKAIRSSLRRSGDGWILNGSKRWTTLGPDGALFFVAARDEAAPGERLSIRVAKVDSNASGLKIEAMPPTKFVPEVPHAQLEFENLKIVDTAILPGDGYTKYVKPFRTVEDIHVNAAIGGGLIAETDAFWEAAASDPAAERWQRDRELLKVAGGIRAQRTQRAWERLRSTDQRIGDG